MAKWKCTVCDYIYDEEKEGKKFDDLAPDWLCPICGAPKSAFEILEGEAPETRAATVTTVADRIVAQLVALGVTQVYGIPGDSNLPFMEALRKQPAIRFVLTRHEETAAFMASAHAKLTGNLGSVSQ